MRHIHFETIDSTNTWAKNHAATLDPSELTCITASEQTAGRGRGSHTWISPPNTNLYLSLYFCLTPTSTCIPNLAQIASLSCTKILEQQGFHPQIKWPNDLLIDNKKLGGVLVETILFQDRIGIVVGIGINVNMSQQELDTIDRPAISLAVKAKHPLVIENILHLLITQFRVDLLILVKEGFTPFLPLYESLLAYKGEKISFSDGSKRIEGICRSIDTNGRLELELPTGEVIKLYSGEVV